MIIVSMPVFSDNLIRPFISGSFATILKQYQDKPVAIVFWSLDCPSCYKELEMLGRLSHNLRRQFNIVLISTDSEVSRDEIQSALSKYNLKNIEAWIFRTDSDIALRYEIDRSWYGELPRSYFYKDSKKIEVISGLLSEEKLKKWFKQSY